MKSIGERAFYSCYLLEDLIIPGNVESIGDSAFEGCSSVKTLTISKGVKYIGMKAFYQCPKIRSVTIPETVESIEKDAFAEGDPELVIHGQYDSAADKYTVNSGILFEAEGTCHHIYSLVCNSCKTNMTKSDLLSAWGINTATGSTISGGSLTIICTIAAAAVFGLGGFFLGRKKKKPALAGGAENKNEE